MKPEGPHSHSLFIDERAEWSKVGSSFTRLARPRLHPQPGQELQTLSTKKKGP
jgi:hypothetical protein